MTFLLISTALATLKHICLDWKYPSFSCSTECMATSLGYLLLCNKLPQNLVVFRTAVIWWCLVEYYILEVKPLLYKQRNGIILPSVLWWTEPDRKTELGNCILSGKITASPWVRVSLLWTCCTLAVILVRAYFVPPSLEFTLAVLYSESLALKRIRFGTVSLQFPMMRFQNTVL